MGVRVGGRGWVRVKGLAVRVHKCMRKKRAHACITHKCSEGSPAHAHACMQAAQTLPSPCRRHPSHQTRHHYAMPAASPHPPDDDHLGRADKVPDRHRDPLHDVLAHHVNVVLQLRTDGNHRGPSVYTQADGQGEGWAGGRFGGGRIDGTDRGSVCMRARVRAGGWGSGWGQEEERTARGHGT